jgi:hypothetical protein
MSDTEDNIPTLNEMIFPGRPKKPKPASKPTSSSDKHTSGHRKPQAKSKGKQTNFEALINKQIDEILERHMLAAREEIVRVVMLELRSRLPNSNRKNS